MKIENHIIRQKQRERAKKNLLAWLLFLPALIVLYFIIWRPQVMGFAWSFFRMKGYRVEEFVGFDNYRIVLSNTHFVQWLLNTVKYVLWSLVVGFIPPYIVALMINEMVHLKNTFKVVIYLPMIVPGIAAFLIWKLMYSSDATGLLNMFLSLFGMEPYVWLQDGRFTILFIVISMTWKSMGGAMLLYFAAVQGISTELYEAAVIDGAGMWKRILHVTLPQTSGVLLLNLIRQIISVFQVMEEPLSMTGGGPNEASVSLGYKIYQYGIVGNNQVGQALAISGIMFVLLIICTIFYFYFNKKIQEQY
ncbi:MAG: sugar ABC transporter permease [Ruminococcaceae bacterium]|nr:sugar ABC transporter permease [Oscillospiraceae bacterium]